MAERIELEIVGKENVKAGMDAAVSEVEKGARRAKHAVDKSMSGKGFAEAFGKAIRGDISGALEDMQQRMDKGFKGISGKAMLWGSGIATALFAGFKAGQKLDEMFGISDKISGAWVKNFGVQEDPAIKARLARLKDARLAAEQSGKASAASAEMDRIGGLKSDQLPAEVEAAKKRHMLFLQEQRDDAETLERRKKLEASDSIKREISAIEQRMAAREQEHSDYMAMLKERLDAEQKNTEAKKAMDKYDADMAVAAANAKLSFAQITYDNPVLWSETKAPFRSSPSRFGRVAGGRGDPGNAREQADNALRMAIDRNFAKEEEDTDKGIARAERRYKLRKQVVDRMSASGVKNMPKWAKRIMDAEREELAANAMAKNIARAEEEKRRAEQHQREVAEQMANDIAAIRAMNEQLLTIR